eukprot:jgi/Ulvmu1/12183/UM085_0047.1
MPDSFNLAASSAVVAGLNLPAMLPSELRAPEHRILQSLGADISDALSSTRPGNAEITESKFGMMARLRALKRSAVNAVGGKHNRSVTHIQPSKRVTRWVIKRCIRAAFELVQREAHCYTRDLYLCCEVVQQHLPQTLASIKRRQSPAMVAAVQRAMSLMNSSSSPASEQPLLDTCHNDDGHAHVSSSQGLAAELWCLLEKYVSIDELSKQGLVEVTRSAIRVASVLDQLALAYMTTMPDRWRPNSESLVAMELAKDSLRKRLPRGIAHGILHRAAATMKTTKGRDVLASTRVDVAHELADKGLLEEHLLCAAVSKLPGAQPVQEFDWDEPHDQAAVIARLKEFQKDFVAAATFEPFVIRGGAQSWPAVQQWTIDHMVQRGSDLRGTVRVSPSPEFPYVMPQHAAALAEVAGHASPPTMTCNMSIAEWALRSLPHGWFAQCPVLVEPIAYGSQSRDADYCPSSTHAQPEWYYMQAELHGLLLEDLDFECGAVPLLQAALQQTSGNMKDCTKPALSSMQLTQAPRLWLSPGGAISPLHFDLSLSHLVQVRGSKRMEFYAPQNLRSLNPFPSAHMLARRCAGVDGSADQSITQDSVLPCYSTILAPGDIVLFAPLWSHHTTSLTTSASVTFRVHCG